MNSNSDKTAHSSRGDSAARSADPASAHVAHTPGPMLTITYMEWRGPRKGAGVSRTMCYANMANVIKTIKTSATVRDRSGEIVGGVQRTDAADDRRVKWMWWLDPDAGRDAGEAK